MNTSVIQEESQTNILEKTFVDGDLINEEDPMLEGGAFKVAFNRTCEIEIREVNEEGNESGTKSIRAVRIVASPDEKGPIEIKLEIANEDNLYQLFECRVNEKKFERIKKAQALNFNFSSLITMLIKQLNLSHKNPQNFQLFFVINKQGPHKFSFVENIEYKNIELMTLDFESVEEELLKECVSFRFKMMKSKREKISHLTEELKKILKLKNPNLLPLLDKISVGNSSLNSTGTAQEFNRSTFR